MLRNYRRQGFGVCVCNCICLECVRGAAAHTAADALARNDLMHSR